MPDQAHSDHIIRHTLKVGLPEGMYWLNGGAGEGTSVVATQSSLCIVLGHVLTANMHSNLYYHSCAQEAERLVHQ